MSDILIRGMEMPRSCMACRLNYGEKRPEHGLTIVCKYSNGVVLPEVIGLEGRLPTCGLIELPEHGDLIDKQAAFKELSEKFKSSDGFVSWTDAIDIVLRAPVIVPANKEE